MRKLHLSILQELARLETQEEREEAIVEILDVLQAITDGKPLPEEEDNPDKRRVNPLDVLWGS